MEVFGLTAAAAGAGKTPSADAWLPDLFIEVGFSFDSILGVLQNLYLNDIVPFTGQTKTIIANHMLFVIEKWYQDCIRSNQRLFGTEENAAEISQILQMLVQNGLHGEAASRANNLRRQIERSYS